MSAAAGAVCWLALLAENAEAAGNTRGPDGSTPAATALVRDRDGRPVGLLAAWLLRPGDAAPSGDARRADPRIVDPAGEAAWVSLVLPSRGGLVLFDDPVVQGARRAVLADAEPADALSTLLVDDRHFAGAVTVRRSGDAERRLREDPFARVHRGAARVLRVDAGLFGSVPAPPGPTIERHGSAVPWPGGRF